MTNGDTSVLKAFGPVILFVLGAALLAAAVNAVGSAFSVAPEWRLALFAFCVVLLAFLFGAVSPLNGARADLVYYLLAAVGIVFLFFDAGVERLRISLAGEYAIATGNRDLFQQKRPELERVLGDISPLLQKFRDAARAPETLARREKALKDCEALQADEAKLNMQRQFDEQLRRIRSVPVSPGAPSPYRPPRLDQGLVPPVDCREVVASAPDLEALATVSAPRDLVEIIRRQSTADLKAELGVDLGSLTMQDVATYLYQALDGKDVRAALDEEQNRLETHVGEVRQQFDALLPSVERGPRMLAWMRQFFWPYVLICAVGLKLSRNNYLKIGA